MSLATIDLVRPSAPTHLTAVRPAPVAAPPETAAPRLRPIPTGTEARGFVLYVGVDEFKAASAGVDLSQLVAALKKLTTELVPTAETHAAVALAPSGAGAATSTLSASRCRTRPRSPGTATRSRKPSRSTVAA